MDEGRAGTLFDKASMEGVGAGKGVAEDGDEKVETPGRDAKAPRED